MKRFKPSWLSNTYLPENTVMLDKNSVNILVTSVRNTMSNILPNNETDIHELKDEAWADLSTVYKYEVEDQKQASREVAHEISEKIMDDEWDSIYRKFYRKARVRNALTPVFATLILVAIGIMAALTAGYWMSLIAGQYTKFENDEIMDLVCTHDAYDNWVITITFKNTGTATSTLIGLYVNDIPATLDSTAPTATVATITTDLNVTTKIESGVEEVITVWVGANHANLSSGTTVNVKIHSSGVMDCIKPIELI